METISASGQLLYAVETDSKAGIPKGKVRVHVVQFQTFEIDVPSFDAMTFKLLDANSKEAATIAKLHHA